MSKKDGAKNAGGGAAVPDVHLGPINPRRGQVFQCWNRQVLNDFELALRGSTAMRSLERN